MSQGDGRGARRVAVGGAAAGRAARHVAAAAGERGADAGAAARHARQLRQVRRAPAHHHHRLLPGEDGYVPLLYP